MRPHAFKVAYAYDILDRVTEVWHQTYLIPVDAPSSARGSGENTRTENNPDEAPVKVFTYGYDNDGNLAWARDLRSATAGETRYDYDLSGRLMRSSRYDDAGVLQTTNRYEYDVNNNLSKLSQAVAGRSWDVIYSYDREDRPVTVTSTGMATVTDAYDAVLGLKTSRSLGLSTPYTVSYGYHVNADGTKTALLESYQNSTDSAYTYAYDANGNITEITHGAATASYVYDKANQLIRENDGLYANRTWTYSYDKHGNMLEKAEYAYTTGALGTPLDTIQLTYYGDQLGSYDGDSVYHDLMGNPTDYLGHTLSWTEGRKLASFGSLASYIYDQKGMRIQKTVGNTVTNYHYNGSLLMGETTGNTSQYYSYDANGNLISLYYNNTYYYYLRNGQGDIVGLIDGTGTVVVAYTYDAWGKALSVTGTLASTLGTANPFRYRGYYYDTETQLYYLQSRYYDPAVCRFLNRDVLISTGQGVLGYNRYLYCLNNPVNRRELDGLCSGFLWWKKDCGEFNCPKSASYAPPADFMPNDSKSTLCLGYVLSYVYAGTGGKQPDAYKKKSWVEPEYNVDDITQRMINLINNHIIAAGAREITDLTELEEGELLIAVRTRKVLFGTNDYHFAIRLQDGTWADKPGKSKARFGFIDPDAAEWPGRYKSAVRYIAVSTRYFEY